MRLVPVIALLLACAERDPNEAEATHSSSLSSGGAAMAPSVGTLMMFQESFVPDRIDRFPPNEVWLVEVQGVDGATLDLRIAPVEGTGCWMTGDGTGEVAGWVPFAPAPCHPSRDARVDLVAGQFEIQLDTYWRDMCGARYRLQNLRLTAGWSTDLETWAGGYDVVTDHTETEPPGAAPPGSSSVVSCPDGAPGPCVGYGTSAYAHLIPGDGTPVLEDTSARPAGSCTP